ncbi:MAG: FixH family protein [Chitinophagaceae bacterium]|nr:FixH family protein [Chitinophagaceae bacterium]MCW5905823.1 FixH family protein [Chitinophagaceae bacterium]
MKYLKYSLLFLCITASIISCKKSNDTIPNNINEVENLLLLKTFSDNGFKVELFNKSGQLKVGYNQIYIRLTDQNGNYVQEASLNWMPMMTMNMGGMIHEHSCPFSEIKKTQAKQTLFEGYITFIMASNGADNFWNLKINFTVNGQTFEVTDTVNVISTDSEFNKAYTSIMGNDGTNYMLALIEPTEPKIGTNDIVVGLFKMGDNNDFPIVNNYKIKIDPRMPGMGNHTAPGNVDMTQGDDGLYHGKVGFSMSGYWKINMILENNVGTAVKGETITELNPESSVNFKLEF